MMNSFETIKFIIQILFIISVVFIKPLKAEERVLFLYDRDKKVMNVINKIQTEMQKNNQIFLIPEEEVKQALSVCNIQIPCEKMSCYVLPGKVVAASATVLCMFRNEKYSITVLNSLNGAILYQKEKNINDIEISDMILILNKYLSRIPKATPLKLVSPD